MLISNRETQLCQVLRAFPYDHRLRYTDEVSQALQKTLFRSLVAENDEYLRGLFHDQVPEPGKKWSLSKAQGMSEDIEYTEAARGKACGHIYKNGDSVFRCKTCTTDDTAVLCTRCFEASDHTGHIVTQSISLGNSGCCDCGDDEAWRVPVNCAIHSADSSRSAGKAPQIPAPPDELLECIKMTIGRAMDYVIDVISCSPENLRLMKTKDIILRDEEQSRLTSLWYDESQEPSPEFALILWNDEKHTVRETEDQVCKACKRQKSFGVKKAEEANDYGRSVVMHSNDIDRLLDTARIIEQIKLTVTIRSSRDTFREQMCGTIIEWLNDIAGCSVGQHNEILRHTICEELLKTWRLGSRASNKMVGKQGLDDHDVEERDELSREYFLAQAIFRQQMMPNLTAPRAREDSDSDSATNDIDDEDGDDEEYLETYNDNEVGVDQMDLDLMTATNPSADADQEMRTPNDIEDGAEVSEATFAGYPPPPPPPPTHQHSRVQSIGTQISEPFANIHFAPSAPSKTDIDIPVTPKTLKRRARTRPPGYWLQESHLLGTSGSLPVHEDMHQRIRLDWLLLYDLRLWKQVRIDLRDLYITTLISNPQTKRIFGLRFAGLYNVLGQLYLIADREPDLSIVNLSVQTFTTPSVTQEVIERGNFLTVLFSMLYTFLTQRAVQHPWQVSVDDSMAPENTSVSNRRMYHFFHDLRYMFGAEFVQNELRTQERYQLQFLDLIRLPQGICPNVRAVGEHVEYENDIWIAAQILTKEVNKLVRQFAEVFHQSGAQSDDRELRQALRKVAKATVVNSIGGERVRFDQAEVKFETRFKNLDPYYFERSINPLVNHSVVEFVVEKEAISFHHPLHYTLSWLIDGGKGMPLERLRNLLTFSLHDLRQPPPYKALVPDQSPEDYLMAVFDFPLRVCAWLAQMKAGMWVRNGLSLRHQMTTYRGVAHRDLAHHRDIFLLQTAMVVCDSSRVLASAVDRFGMDQWMRGDCSVRNGFEPGQQLDVAEEFIHLLIVLISDRTSLQVVGKPGQSKSVAIRRDIAHILCFKPLSFSELNQRFADKSTDLEDFQELLDEMTHYRPPDGLSDSGSFELKAEYMDEIDPYAAHYTKNQRDEAENIYRSWLSKRTGKPVADIVYEPKLISISAGIFKELSNFTGTPLFAQIIFYSLLVSSNPHRLPDIPATRVEAYLHIVLHLVLIAVLEDEGFEQPSDAPTKEDSFVFHALKTRSELGLTVFELLIKTLEVPSVKLCHPQIRLILHRVHQKRPEGYNSAIALLLGSNTSQDVDKLGLKLPNTPGDNDEEAKLREAGQLKKKQALDRQAKVMAQFQQQQQNFMDNQESFEWDDEEDSLALGNAEDQTKIWRFPTGNCILCQEETSDSRLYGTFGFMTNSKIFRQTDVRDPDILNEVLLTPDNLDRSAQSIRPFGMAGSNRTTVVKRAFNGQESSFNHQGLAKGFPPAFAFRGPVSAGCGHIMHYSCFEVYFAATERRHRQQIARQHPERTKLKEFVCPLCKALGNTFLPIVWKGKEEVYHASLQPAQTFEDWLFSGIGVATSRYFKTQEGASVNDRLQDHFKSYLSKTVVAPLVGGLMSPTYVAAQLTAASPASPQSSGRNVIGSLPSLWRTDSDSVSSPIQPASTEMSLINEFMNVYSRMRDTIQANELSSGLLPVAEAGKASTKAGTKADVLSRIFGLSITSAEIAQRGVDSQVGQTLIDSIPSSVLTHLHVLSETVSTYIAVAIVTGDDAYRDAGFSESAKRQLFQLFAGHPHVNHDLSGVFQPDSPPALIQDPFVLLAECSIVLVPAFNMEISHVLQLCYILQLVKVTLYLSGAPESFDACSSRPLPTITNHIPKPELETFRMFLCRLLRLPSLNTLTPSDQTLWEEHIGGSQTPEHYSLIFRAVSKYALIFLRKAAVLMHVRYGVDFSGARLSHSEGTETTRLTAFLNLPSLAEIFGSLGHSTQGQSHPVEALIEGWITHWRLSQSSSAPSTQDPLGEVSDASKTRSAYDSLRPGHPAIFELVGLPEHFETLTYEVTRRRCPTKGHKLEDPNLCLFCGDFFCGQALCCSKKNKGGCFQHMQR